MSSIRFDQVAVTDWSLDDLFYRERRQAPLMPQPRADRHVTGADLSALMPALPVLGGALATILVSLPAMVSGVDASQWLFGLLVSSAMIMVALAVSRGRPGMSLVAAINLVLVVSGAWLAAATEISATRVLIWHLVLVATVLVGMVPRRDPATRVWLGAELGMLVLAGLFL